MHVPCLPIHPSPRVRELPWPIQSTRRLPKPTNTDLGHDASVQTRTSRRRTLITGRTILATVSTTIPTRGINRGARPRTRLVPAVPRPRLVAATAGATLGAPRCVAIQGLVGSRGLFSQITGARPAGAPSTCLLRPAKMVLLPLLMDVQEAPELVVDAGTGPPLHDRLQSLGVPHRVRLHPNEQVVRQAPKHVDQRDQEHAGGKIQPTPHGGVRQEAPARPHPPTPALPRYRTGVSLAPGGPTASG